MNGLKLFTDNSATDDDATDELLAVHLSDLLNAYGAYGISSDPWFSVLRLSLLDRGGPEPRAGQFYMLAADTGWGGDEGRPYLARAFSVA